MKHFHILKCEHRKLPCSESGGSCNLLMLEVALQGLKKELFLSLTWRLNWDLLCAKQVLFHCLQSLPKVNLMFQLELN